MFEVYKIDLPSALRVAAVFGALMGVVTALLFTLLSSFWSYGAIDYWLVNYGGAALLYGGVMIAANVIGALIFTLVAVPLYNFLAEEFGGFHVDLRRSSAEESSHS